MDWTHVAAFCLGFVVFVLMMGIWVGRTKSKVEVHTRRDFMASSALRARIMSGESREQAAYSAVQDADALLAALDRQ